MQVGKFLENIKRADQNKAVYGDFFFLKINNHVDQNKAVHIGWIRCERGIFSQN